MVDNRINSSKGSRIDREEPPYFELVQGISDEIRNACERLAATNPRKYQRTRSQSDLHGSGFEAEYYTWGLANALENLHGKEREVLLESLQNTPLVNLCSGTTWTPDSPGVTFADLYGASSYIGVDHVNAIHGAYDANDLKESGFNSLKGSLTVRGDAREFLRYLPSNAVNFMMAGVDENMWNDDPESEGYVPEGFIDEVRELMIDRCKKGGVILLDNHSRRRLGLREINSKNLEEVHELILRKKF